MKLYIQGVYLTKHDGYSLNQKETATRREGIRIVVARAFYGLPEGMKELSEISQYLSLDSTERTLVGNSSSLEYGRE